MIALLSSVARFAFGFLGLGRRVLEDECAQLVSNVHASPLPACFAVPDDVLRSILHDYKIRLGVLARPAKDKLVDEPIKQFTKTGGITGAVDDVAVVFVIRRSLRTQLAAEEFGSVGRRTRKGAGDVRHVGDDSLDAIALAFNFRQQNRHAGSIHEDIVDRSDKTKRRERTGSGKIYRRHRDGFLLSLQKPYWADDWGFITRGGLSSPVCHRSVHEGWRTFAPPAKSLQSHCKSVTCECDVTSVTNWPILIPRNH